MEIKAFYENFDHCKKAVLPNTFCRTVFCTVSLVGYFLMVASMKLNIIQKIVTDV